ncbi:MAG: diguanylate cyclase [Betaproteobacteria bacterium]|nr:diguanylate cyclase [Betaproteobacteria bacterium]
MMFKSTQLSFDQQEMIRLMGPLFEEAQMVFGFKDRQHRYLYVNDELAQVLGCPVEEIIGRRADDFVMHANSQMMYSHQNEVMSSGKAVRYVDQIGVKNRAYTFVSVYFPQKDNLGVITGIGFIGILIQDRDWLDAGLKSALEKTQETLLDLQKQVEDMRLQATTDPLTGIWNRVQAEIFGQQEMVRRMRNGNPVAIVFADLDHFKNVNDSWGHAVGDAVLVEFCRVVKSCLRACDVLARWGGEEFVIILPDTSLEEAQVAAERIRVTIEKHHFDHIKIQTASFGVAAYLSGETWHEWVERADAALYRAKNKGRNRVELDTTNARDDMPQESAYPSRFLRLAWRQDYECGHPVIDHQHKQLFAATNNLLSAFLAGKSEKSIKILIDGLIVDMMNHFRDEEEIFRAVGYPQSDAHANRHEDVVDKVRKMSDCYYNGELELGELFSFLAYEVIIMNMLADDKGFFSYFNGNADAAALEPSVTPAKPKKAPAGKNGLVQDKKPANTEAASQARKPRKAVASAKAAKKPVKRVKKEMVA